MLNKSILTNDVQKLEAAYRELLKVDNSIIRIAIEPVLCQLRGKISQLTLRKQQIVQEINEHIARAEKSQAKFFNASMN
jgi:hypothetical protein